ncbi:MAG: GNAT family N-acetyltransferase, partial [Pseudomonadota bacterium]
LTGREDQQALQRAIDDYVLVAVRSWKVPNSTVSSDILDEITLAAETRCLRLGILKLNGRAIAAQFWVFSAGVASAVRLNFDEQYRKSAPGVVLSNLCIEYLLDVDHAIELDFGYGGDAYKEKWMKQSRYYCGFMAFNTSTPKGLAYGAAHILGQAAKRLVRKILLRGPEISIRS